MILSLIALFYFIANIIKQTLNVVYMYSLDWIKKKETTINPKNDDSKCFQHAATIASNHEKIESRPERVSDIKSSINN